MNPTKLPSQASPFAEKSIGKPSLQRSSDEPQSPRCDRVEHPRPTQTPSSWTFPQYTQPSSRKDEYEESKNLLLEYCSAPDLPPSQSRSPWSQSSTPPSGSIQTASQKSYSPCGIPRDVSGIQPQSLQISTYSFTDVETSRRRLYLQQNMPPEPKTPQSVQWQSQSQYPPPARQQCLRSPTPVSSVQQQHEQHQKLQQKQHMPRPQQHPHPPSAPRSLLEANYAAIQRSNRDYMQKEAIPFIKALDVSVKEDVLKNIQTHLKIMSVGNFSEATENQMCREAILAQRREMGMAPPRQGGKGARNARSGRGMNQASRRGHSADQSAHCGHAVGQTFQGHRGMDATVARGDCSTSQEAPISNAWVPNNGLKDLGWRHSNRDFSMERVDNRFPCPLQSGHNANFQTGNSYANNSTEDSNSNAASGSMPFDDQDDESDGGVFALPRSHSYSRDIWRNNPNWRKKPAEREE